MPKRAKRTRKSRAAPVGVLVAVIYDPGNRQDNVRLVIEGPFSESADAVRVLQGLLKDGRYSCAGTHVCWVSSDKHFRTLIDGFRAALNR